MEQNTQKPASTQPGQMPQSHTQGPVKKSRKGLVVIVVVVAGIVLISIGVFLGYRYYKQRQQAARQKAEQEDKLKKQLQEQNQLMPPEIKTQEAIPVS